ncbi:MAG TPA: hypothetical protein VJG90_06200 [Candidatus Nanoarchaeia archaeon]|nr:hypothetical protein [Candidatus Nanoarchaeia archaeon]
MKVQAGLAIAVVLLPPPKIMNLCIKLNQEAKKEGRMSLPLGKKVVPHICLAVGCIEEKSLAEIKKRLKSLHIKPIKTVIVEKTHFNSQEQGSPDNKGCLKVKKTQEFGVLQKRVSKAVASLFFYNATSEMFFKEKGKKVSQKTIQNVNQYMKMRCGKNYNPHISLKGWGFPNKKLHLQFTINTLAVFQMGEGCTCRKLLFKITLRNE